MRLVEGSHLPLVRGGGEEGGWGLGLLVIGGSDQLIVMISDLAEHGRGCATVIPYMVM